MKTNQSILKTVLICVVIVLALSCKKSVDAPPAPITWNYSTFTDARDGKTYKYLKIGSQEWMAENLAFTTNGGSWNSNDSQSDGVKFGRLYTWNAAIQAVPAGWHLPSDTEWKQLEMTLGMSQADADGINSRGTNEGSKLKATSGWGNEVNGLNDVGFNALPGGIRSNSGSFFALDWYGYWWTATDDGNSKAWLRYLIFESSKVFRTLSSKDDAYSVRCVKD